MKRIYLDCFSGAAGDMLVGALIDLGADFMALRDALLRLGVHGFDVRAEKVVKHGVSATKFHVDIDHDAHQPHRHLSHVLRIIEAGGLPDEVTANASETFRRIADAEAAVHGTTPEKVHFHEVGAVDSIVDIVGIHLALHQLGVERVDASPLVTGSGTVQTAHGLLPVPAPATALLVRGIPVEGGSVEGELLTPTAAAVITQLACSYGAMPAMAVEAVGYGAGTKELHGRPNVVRAVLGVDAAVTNPDVYGPSESVTVMETNLDDMPAELLSAFISDVINAGARDAFITPITGKKGRPAHLITVLCDEQLVGAVADCFFRNTSTFGLRMRTEQRFCLERSWRHVSTPWGKVRVKLGRPASGGADTPWLRCSPEFEDCRQTAASAGSPVMEVYQAALAAAVKGEWTDG